MLLSSISEPEVKPHDALFRLALELGESVYGAVWLTARDREKWMDVYGQIEELGRMPIAELRERYQEVFGEQTATAHKHHLVRRIAWRLQVLAEGDLSERAHRRAMKIADDRDLRVNVPASAMQLGRVAVKRRPIQPDPRRPLPGSVLSRAFRGQTIEVKVREDGFEYQGQRYGSLSAVARAATGTRWNGLIFFGLGKREMAKPGKAHRSAAR
jgi:hypothetical protein